AGELRSALAGGAPAPEQALLGNDLQPAASSLCEQIAPALARASDIGGIALLSGSGPTVLALFPSREGAEQADAAAAALAGLEPRPTRARSVEATFAQPHPVDASSARSR